MRRWPPVFVTVGGLFATASAKIGSQVIVPYRGDELDFRHLKVSGDLGQVVPSFYAIRDADRLRRLVESSDIVVNLVGRDYETSNFKFDDVHVTAAANVARACRETGVTRLVHVSAASASKDSPSRFLKSKALGEAAVRAEFPGATIVRPSWMFGHEDRLFNRIAFLHMMPTIPGDPVLHNGEAKYRPVFVSDVAEAIVRASRNSDTAGQTYELVGYVRAGSARATGVRRRAHRAGREHAGSAKLGRVARFQAQSVVVPRLAQVLWRGGTEADPAHSVPRGGPQVRRSRSRRVGNFRPSVLPTAHTHAPSPPSSRAPVRAMP